MGLDPSVVIIWQKQCNEWNIFCKIQAPNNKMTWHYWVLFLIESKQLMNSRFQIYQSAPIVVVFLFVFINLPLWWIRRLAVSLFCLKLFTDATYYSSAAGRWISILDSGSYDPLQNFEKEWPWNCEGGPEHKQGWEKNREKYNPWCSQIHHREVGANMMFVPSIPLDRLSTEWSLISKFNVNHLLWCLSSDPSGQPDRFFTVFLPLPLILLVNRVLPPSPDIIWQE